MESTTWDSPISLRSCTTITHILYESHFPLKFSLPIYVGAPPAACSRRHSPTPMNFIWFLLFYLPTFLKQTNIYIDFSIFYFYYSFNIFVSKLLIIVQKCLALYNTRSLRIQKEMISLTPEKREQQTMK
jgi:hypothetical protein